MSGERDRRRPRPEDAARVGGQRDESSLAARTALLDQVRAATRQAHSALHRAAVAHGYAETVAPASPWCRQLLDGVLGRTARFCKHLRGGASPQVLFVAAHRRRVECAGCAYRATRATLGTEEDRRCDRCRTLIAVGEVEAVTWAVGPMLVSAGHCRGCRDAVRGSEVPT
jgi:hypothetical protein